MAEEPNKRRRIESTSKTRALLDKQHFGGRRGEEELLLPGLLVIRTMVTAFVRDVDNWTYRWQNNNGNVPVPNQWILTT